jgi:hypothetical protein
MVFTSNDSNIGITEWFALHVDLIIHYNSGLQPAACGLRPAFACTGQLTYQGEPNPEGTKLRGTYSKPIFTTKLVPRPLNLMQKDNKTL